MSRTCFSLFSRMVHRALSVLSAERGSAFRGDLIQSNTFMFMIGDTAKMIR